MARRSRLFLAGLGLAVFTTVFWPHQLSYALHVVLRHGGTWWRDVPPDSPHLSPAMRLALAEAPDAEPGDVAWLQLAPGFETSDLSVAVGDQIIDHILLARIDPALYRFVLRNAPAGDRDLGDWMTQLGAVLIVNGPYFTRSGEPATPLVSDGQALGPRDYDAKAGAFVASTGSAAIHDLTTEDWQTAFHGAENAAVSFPMLLAHGENRVRQKSDWLANRSFVAQDSAGRIVIGTTTDAFFSLDRLARFLLRAPLGLTYALNLDGGPVACQGIALGDYRRMSYGHWEAQVDGDRVKLLTLLYGDTVAMPIVLAVLPKVEEAAE